MTKKKGQGRPVGETLGGILAGFDQQIMRSTPPAHELVEKGAPVRGIVGADGSDLVIDLPDLVPAEPDLVPQADVATQTGAAPAEAADTGDDERETTRPEH